MTFRNIADLKNGAAVFMDFTNRILIERGVDVSVRTEEEAAEVLARIASENRFTLYEYFITDKVGHEQDMPKAKEVLTSLARFIRELLVRLDLKTHYSYTHQRSRQYRRSFVTQSHAA